MAKDVIRADAVRRYVHVPVGVKNQASSMISQNLPLVAMFLKSKPVAWGCLFIAVQTFLNEPLIKDPSDESQPAIFRVLFALVAIGTSYLDIFFPNSPATVAKKV